MIAIFYLYINRGWMERYHAQPLTLLGMVATLNLSTGTPLVLWSLVPPRLGVWFRREQLSCGVWFRYLID
jgi:hypothetical protein